MKTGPFRRGVTPSWKFCMPLGDMPPRSRARSRREVAFTLLRIALRTGPQSKDSSLSLLLRLRRG